MIFLCPLNQEAKVASTTLSLAQAQLLLRNLSFRGSNMSASRAQSRSAVFLGRLQNEWIVLGVNISRPVERVGPLTTWIFNSYLL